MGTHADIFLKLYERLISPVQSRSNIELNDLAFQLGVELTGQLEDDIQKLAEKARLEYLYHWSLELDPDSVTEDEIQPLAESLGVLEPTGTPSEVIESLRRTALVLTGRCQIEDLPHTVQMQIIEELDPSSRLQFAGALKSFREIAKMKPEFLERSLKVAAVTGDGNQVESLINWFLDHSNNFNFDLNYLLQMALNHAALGGHQQLIIDIGEMGLIVYNIKNKSEVYSEAMIWAADGNQFTTVTFLFDQGADNREMIDEALDIASKKGNIEVVQVILENSRHSLDLNNNAMKSAIMNGHLEIVTLLNTIQYYENSYRWGVKWGLEMANLYGRREIHQILLDRFLVLAALHGEYRDVAYLIEGATSITEAANAAAAADFGGHPEIVKLLIESAGANVDSVLSHAVSGGNIDIVRSLIKLRPNVINAMLTAIDEQHRQIFMILSKYYESQVKDQIEKLAVINQLIQRARSSGWGEIVALLNSWSQTVSSPEF